MRAAGLALLLGVLTGCTTHHYVALEEAPLYASPTSDEVLGRLPRYHHEALPEEPRSEAGRLLVTLRGRPGYAPGRAVRVFSYLDPELDGGADRDEAVAHELREAQLADLGGAWPEGVVEAIRRSDVVPGMTRRQVELAWGWPLTVLPTEDGGEHWVYRHDTYETVHRYLSDAWSYPSSFSPYVGFRWASPGRNTWCYDGWVSVRLPVTEERVVELDPRGRVTDVHVRRLLRDDG